MCLLPLMNVQCKGENLDVLWDTGATISLITVRAAKELGLAKGAKRYLTVVGGCVEEIDSRMYMLPLTDERNKIIHVQVYGVERISSNINRIDISGVASLFNVSCKEGICNIYGNIDVLIGINYAAIQLQRKQTLGNLILYGNRFGKCIA